MKYTCEQCKNAAKQINLDRAKKKWLCNDCFYNKEVKIISNKKQHEIKPRL
jgi:transposase-like protein